MIYSRKVYTYTYSAYVERLKETDFRYEHCTMNKRKKKENKMDEINDPYSFLDSSSGIQ